MSGLAGFAKRMGNCVLAEQRQACIELFWLSEVDREQLQCGETLLVRFAAVVDRVVTGNVAAEDAGLFDGVVKLGQLSFRRVEARASSQRGVYRRSCVRACR